MCQLQISSGLCNCHPVRRGRCGRSAGKQSRGFELIEGNGEQGLVGQSDSPDVAFAKNPFGSHHFLILRKEDNISRPEVELGFLNFDFVQYPEFFHQVGFDPVWTLRWTPKIGPVVKR